MTHSTHTYNQTKELTLESYVNDAITFSISSKGNHVHYTGIFTINMLGWLFNRTINDFNYYFISRNYEVSLTNTYRLYLLCSRF